MIINKERVKAFVNATKEDARLAASSGGFSKYSFDSFCREHNLYVEGLEERSGGTVISCPFHRDDSPSCSLNDTLGVFNCFSCGGGTYWKFVYRYHTEVLGEETTMYSLMNRYLQQDPVLMATLQFNTLFETKERVTLEGLKTIKKTSFKRDKILPQNYLELQRIFMRRNPSTQQIKLFITLMQEGVPVDIAYRELIEGKQSKKSYDLSEMNNF